MRRTLLAAAVYGLAAMVFTWPLVPHLRTLFGAQDPTRDPSLYLWTLGWDLRTLSTHPAWLLTGRVFNANIFFPARDTLAYSDHLLPQAIALWPIYAVTHDLVLCYNLLLLGSLAAAALTMHLLARALAGSERAAYVAGLIFGFAPYHFTHLTHLQLQALYFLPLSYLFLHRLFTTERRSDTVALGVVLGLQATSSVYYGVIGSLGVLCAAVTLAILTGRTGDWRLVRRGATAAALAVLIALPWSVAYMRAARATGAGRNLYEAEHSSAVLASYVQAPATNLLYGRTGWLRPGAGARLPRKDGPEQALFPGFCALLLAAFGALAAPRALRQTALVYATVAIIGVVLSLGPDGVRPLYAGLYRVMSGMEAIRAAARFSVLFLVSVAVLAAVGVAALEDRLPRTHAVVAPLMALILAVEYLNGSIAFPPPPALASEGGRWLHAQPGNGVVVCLPMGFDAGNTRCMLQSLEHGRSIVNGYSGIRPPFFAALVDLVSRMPSADALRGLHDIGVEWVASDRALTIDPALRNVLPQRAQFGDEHLYQIMWSPVAEALSDAAAAASPPPEPGTPPFAVGESLTYEIHWTSGPTNLPAGEATLSVAPPQAHEAFRFALSARTAPWVSRFFESAASLETTATDRVFPIAHQETINEGRRRVERQLEFDFVRHEVRMVTGGNAVVLPLAPSARDPLTALFYVRTLPLTASSRFTLPLTDNGRASQLEVSVGSVESIVLDGRARSAWKLEPRQRQRIEREDPLHMTVWLSADARRVPLRFDVAAGFGSVRADLREVLH